MMHACMMLLKPMKDQQNLTVNKEFDCRWMSEKLNPEL